MTRTACRPDALVLIYPWKVAVGDAVRDDILLDGQVPATLIMQSVDDKTSPPQAAVKLFEALLAANRPAELHIYEAGGHGFGMKQRPSGGLLGDWPNRVLEWLRGRGF
jgi:acetyl esterase/lipase